MMMPSRARIRSAAASSGIFLLLPLLSIVYGSFLPAGLFIYWIVTTIFSIVQQYLIVGLGLAVPAVRMDARVRRRTTHHDSRRIRRRKPPATAARGEPQACAAAP